jgi:hypothetical protein|nr:MAG TPA: hypothetical protein [Caudoviricetes sp.]
MQEESKAMEVMEMRLYLVFRAKGVDVFAKEKLVNGYRGFILMQTVLDATSLDESPNYNIFAQEMRAIDVADLFIVETGIESVKMENVNFGEVSVTREGDVLKLKGDRVEMVFKSGENRGFWFDDFIVDVKPYVEE